MKNKDPRFLGTLIGLILSALALVFFSGCSTAAGIINSASTKIEVRDVKGKSFMLTFPKELQASALHVSINPATGVIELKADQLKSSSTSIIESAGVIQAQSNANLTAALLQAMPLIAKGAATVATVEGAPAAGAIIEALAQPVVSPSNPPNTAPIAPFVVPGITPVAK